MVWRVQNPKTGDIYEIEEEWDEKSQTDTAREAALAKGYVPVIEVVNPKTGESYEIDDREFSEASKKGYVTKDVHEAREKMMHEAQTKDQDVSQLEAAGLGAARWGSMEFADEAAAAVAAPMGALKQAGKTMFGIEPDADDTDVLRYQLAKAREEAAAEEAWKKHPVSYGVGAAAGVGAHIGGAIRATPKLTQETIKRAAAVGAVEGAAGAAGASEAEGPEDFWKETAIGASLGGALGAAAPAIGRGIAKVRQKAVEKATKEVAGDKEALEQIHKASKSFNEEAREEAFSIKSENLINKQIRVVEELKKTPHLRDLAVSRITKAANVLDRIDVRNPRNAEAVKKLNKAIADNQADIRFIDSTLATIKNRTGKEADAFVLPQTGKASPELERVFRNELIDRNLLKNSKKFTERAKGIARHHWITRVMSDVMPQFDSISTKYGVDLVSPLREYSKRLNYSKNAMKEGFDVLRKKKADSSKPLKAPELMREASSIIKKHFGVEPPIKIEDYVPRQRKDFMGWAASAIEEAERLGYRFQEVPQKGGLMGRFQPKQWKVSAPKGIDTPENLERFYRELEHMTQEKNPIKALEKIRNIERGLPSETDLIINRFLARADNETGAIPKWARETNPENLFTSYVKNVGDLLAKRDSLEEMERTLKLFERSKVDEEVQTLIRNVIDDVKGIPRRGKMRKGDATAAFSMDQIKRKQQLESILKAQKAIRTGDSKTAQKEMNKLAAGSLSSHLSSLIYANALSRPLSALKNLGSPFVQSMPWIASHIGYAEASRMAAKSLLRTVSEVGKEMKKNPKDLVWGRKMAMQEVVNRGLNPANYTGEQVAQMRNGVLRGLMDQAEKAGVSTKGAERIELMGRMADSYSRVLMTTFSASEQIARNWSFQMSKELTAKALKDPKVARKFVENIVDAPTKRRLSDAFLRGDKEEALRGVSEYVNAQTLFNYDRANMAEFGRTMGPLFSTFSKWPTTIAGQVVARMHTAPTKGAAARRLGTYLIGPYAAAAGLMAWMRAAEVSENPRSKRFLGDLKSWTAMDSLMLDPRYGIQPPAVDLVISFIGMGKSVLDGEEGRRQIKKSAEEINRMLGVGGAWESLKDWSLILDEDNRQELEDWLRDIKD